MTLTVDNKADYSTPSARWRAIVNRDAQATCFVYGVRTTKIYCRPRCPARLARRANVEFYDTPKQAEKAGYRPCKRCKPEDLRAPADPHIKLARQACETMVLAALSGGEKQRPTLQDLATEAGLTPSHFHRVFKKVVGVTPGKYARDLIEGKTIPKGLNSGFIPASLTWAQPAASIPATAPLPSHQEEQQPTHHQPLHPPNTVPIDWNEFDLMLAATTGAKPQMSSDETNGGLYFSRDNDLFSPNPVVLGGTLATTSEQPGQAATAPIGFSEYVNDTIDFSVGADKDLDTSDKVPSPISVPSSQQSLSPTDSPQLFDSYTSLTASPLMLEDVDWMENTGIYQGYGPYSDMLDFRDGPDVTEV
ncbi:hypothetical protein VTO42DRAFT_5667 [Malbranchea cinnamomea]